MPTPEQAIDIGERLGLSRDEAEEVGFEIVGGGGLMSQIHGDVGTRVPTDAFRAFLGSTTFRGWKMEQKEFARTLLEQALQERGGVPDLQKVMDAYRALEKGGATPPPAPAASVGKQPTPGAHPGEAEAPFTYPSGGQGKKKQKQGGGGQEQQERAKRADPENFSLRLLEQDYGNTIRRLPDGSLLLGSASSEGEFKTRLQNRLRAEFPVALFPTETDAHLQKYVDGWLRFKLATLSDSGGKKQEGGKSDPKKIEAEMRKRIDPETYALETLHKEYWWKFYPDKKTGEVQKPPDDFKLTLMAILRAEFPSAEFPNIDDTKLREFVETWWNKRVADVETKGTLGKKAKKPEEKIEERVKAIKEKLRLIGYGEELDAKTVEQDFGNESKEKALYKIVQKLLSKDTKDERTAKNDLIATVGSKYHLSPEQCADIYDALKLELIASAQAQEKIKGKFWRIFRPHTRQGKITKAAAFAGAGVASAAGFGWLGLVATGGLRAIDRFVTRKVDTKLLNQYRERNKSDDKFLQKMQGRLAGLVVETKRRGLEAEHAKTRAEQQTDLEQLRGDSKEATEFETKAPRLLKEARDKKNAAQTAFNNAETARQAAEQKATDAQTARATAERFKNDLPALKTAQKTAREALTAAEKTERAAHDALQNARLHSPPDFPAIEQSYQAAGVATAQARTAFDNANRLFIAAEAEAKKFKAAQKNEQEAAKASEAARIAERTAKKQLDDLAYDFTQLELKAIDAPSKAQELREQVLDAWDAEQDRQTQEHPSERYSERIFNYLLAEEALKPDARLRMPESELRGVAERLAVYYAMDDLADRAEREAMEKREWHNISGWQRVGKALAAPMGELPPRERRSAILGRFLAGGSLTLTGLILNRGNLIHTSPWAIRLASAYEGWKLGEAVHETGARLSHTERIEKEIVAAEALRKLMENKDKPNARLQALDDLETTLGQLSVRLAEFPNETKEGAKFLAWKEKVRELTLAVVAARFEKREDDTTQDSFDAITERLEKLKKSQIEAVTAKNKTFSEKTLREKGAALLPSAELAKKLTGAAAGLALAEAGINLADLK